VSWTCSCHWRTLEVHGVRLHEGCCSQTRQSSSAQWCGVSVPLCCHHLCVNRRQLQTASESTAMHIEIFLPLAMSSLHPNTNTHHSLLNSTHTDNLVRDWSLVSVVKKMRPWECDRHTGTNQFYNLSHAICSSVVEGNRTIGSDSWIIRVLMRDQHENSQLWYLGMLQH